MKIKTLVMRRLQLPMVTAFSHNSATRSVGSAVWVEAIGIDGQVGFGEACPRPYVTDEDMDSALEFFSRHQRQWIGEIYDLASLRQWVEQNSAIIDRSPAAFAAVELALLDLFARERDQSIEQLLGITCQRRHFRYSAVIGSGSKRQFAAQLKRYKNYGFSHYKVKLCGDLAQDKTRVEMLEAAGLRADTLRADANNLWTGVSEAVDYMCALGCPFWAVEEPFKAGDFAAMGMFAEALDCRVIVDESCLNKAHLAAIVRQDLPADRVIVNLRVSKQGGLIRALEHNRIARDNGHDVIVGAHVGESSVLTRAGLVLASAAGESLVGHEGGFGSWLLSRDVVAAPLMFGPRGVLSNSLLGQPGFGLTPSRLALAC